MDVYMYQAALYCADCGESIKASLHTTAPETPNNEHSFDSDDYPKGPYPNGGGEADCPNHCDGCGTFLENPLTSNGVEYVKNEHKEYGSEVTQEWLDFYDYIEV